MTRLGAAAVGVVLALFVLAVVGAGPAAAQQEDVTLTINVTDSNGDPIGGVSVVATWNDGENTTETTTVSNGMALIDVPEGADVEITVEHEEYVRNYQPVEVTNAESQEVDIRMSLSGTVDFSVQDTENGNPIEDVRLIVTHPGEAQPVEVVRTDADGTAQLPDIEQRAYEVDLSRAQYFDATESFVLDSSTRTESYEMERGFTRVDFRVTDSHFSPGRPLENARIAIEETGDVLTTRSDGIQDIRLPVNDEYTLTVTKDAYDGVTATLDLGQQRQQFNVSIERTPLISIEPLNDAVVVGQTTQVTITNAYGEPVEGAPVTRNGDSLGRTGPGGTIQFEITETGDNEIEANYRGLSDNATIEGVERGQDPGNGTDDDGSPDDGSADDGSADDGSADDGSADDGSADDDTSGNESMDDGGDDSEGDADSLGPGFGIVAAAVALLGAALLARRRV